MNKDVTTVRNLLSNSKLRYSFDPLVQRKEDFRETEGKVKIKFEYIYDLFVFQYKFERSIDVEKTEMTDKNGNVYLILKEKENYFSLSTVIF